MVVWKYPLKKGFFKIPQNREFLYFGKDLLGNLCAWFLVDPSKDAAQDYIKFDIVWTGEEVPAGSQYISTFLDTGLVNHVFIEELNRNGIEYKLREQEA